MSTQEQHQNQKPQNEIAAQIQLEPTEPTEGDFHPESGETDQAPLPPDLNQNHPRWRRRLGTFLIASGLINVGVASGAVDEFSDRAHASTVQKQVKIVDEPSSREQLDKDIKALLGSEREQYEKSQVKVKNKPFEVVPTAHNLRAERFVVQPALKAYKAKFEGAVQLTSGIKMNLYTSKLDNKKEPLEIDYKALDVFVNRLIHEAGNIENNPIAEQIAIIQKQALEGTIDLQLNTVLVSDEKLCLGEPLAGSHIKKLVKSSFKSCMARGASYRVVDENQPSTNQFIIALDTGRYLAPAYYQNYNREDDQRLSPNAKKAITYGHEIAHALFGITDLNGVLDDDQEHELFVFPLESNMYDFYCSLKKEDSRYVTPVHVDTKKTSNPPRNA